MVAETEDDLSTLTLPAEESAPVPSPQEDLKPDNDASKSPEPQVETPLSKAEDSPFINPSDPREPCTHSGKPQKQRYPLYPSITQLLHENSLSASEAEKIPASGPRGRLLKGDVLGHLGRISSTYSSEESTRITKLGQLDLRNVRPVQSKATAPSQPSKAQAQKAPKPQLERTDTEVAILVSLSSVISVQERIQEALGVTLPLSTFITRATELANNGLPRSAATKRTADELFNDVLGLNNINTKTFRGRYVPQITALPAKPVTKRVGLQRQPDIYDILAGTPSTTAPLQNAGLAPPGIMAGSKTGESTNVFSVSAAKGEEKGARVFLERVKTTLQVEPGRLVL